MGNDRNIYLYKVEDIFKAKELYHKELARISFEEKIKILVRLQKIANVIPSKSKKRQRVWYTLS